MRNWNYPFNCKIVPTDKVDRIPMRNWKLKHPFEDGKSMQASINLHTFLDTMQVKSSFTPLKKLVIINWNFVNFSGISREVAQSGLAHLNGVQGVAGSNPALPMLFDNVKT